MNIISKLFSKIYSWIFPFKNNLIEEALEDNLNTEEAEVIRPGRFSGSDPDEESDRDINESLRLKERFLISDEEVKLSIAGKTRDPILQIAALEVGGDKILYKLINNPRIEEEILYRLVSDEAYDLEDIKMEIAKKFSLPLEVQKKIAESKYLNVRREFVNWQKPINPAIAKIFAEDEDIWIRTNLAKTIGCQMKVDNMLFFKGKYDITYRILMRDKSDKVRYALAQNESIGDNIQCEMIEYFYSIGDLASIRFMAGNKGLKNSAQRRIIDIIGKPTLRVLEIKLISRDLKNNPSLDKNLKQFF